MEVIYHPLSQQDVLEILRYYHHISARLADEFRDELDLTLSKAADSPSRFPPGKFGFHRANLKRFPYHILYEIQPAAIRVMVIRHNKRHPDFGIHRH